MCYTILLTIRIKALVKNNPANEVEDMEKINYLTAII